MLQINSDLGEGFDAVDAALIPLIDQASIACGGHAGTETSMRKCLQLAKKHNTLVGAHPSYPDKENFGRRSLSIASNDLSASITSQVLTLLDHCQTEGVVLSYVKPHGALYNDMINQPAIFDVLCTAIKKINAQRTNSLKLMVPGCMANRLTLQKNHLEFLFEGFADRAYSDDGGLVSRREPHAVHSNQVDVISQVTHFIQSQGVYSENKVWLSMPIDTLCVHGDTADALALVKAIRMHMKALHER